MTLEEAHEFNGRASARIVDLDKKVRTEMENLGFPEDLVDTEIDRKISDIRDMVGSIYTRCVSEYLECNAKEARPGLIHNHRYI